MDQQGLARLQIACLEHIGEHGADSLGQGGGLDPVQGVGNRQGVTGVDHRMVGIAATAQQGADAIPDGPARDAVADLVDLARDLETEDVGGSGRGRIAAEPLQDVGTVDAGGTDPDANLAGAGDRFGSIDQGQGGRRTGPAGDFHCLHLNRPALAIVRRSAFR